MLAQKFKEHLAQHLPELLRGKTIVTVSGGVDSMVLLHLFHSLQLDFAVAHCNFRLRGTESDLDEKLVESYCRKNEIKYFVSHFETEEYTKEHKVSIQIAARKLRYDWFKELLQQNGHQFIATAHHLDDQAETFLINFTRGTGIDGLLGIPERNNEIVRPLLPFSRNEILTYANEQKIEWREDASNATTKYLRNKIRHLVLPILKEENEQFLKSFQNTVQYLKQTQLLANDALRIFTKTCVTETQNQTKIDLEKASDFSNNMAYISTFLRGFGFGSQQEIEKLLKTDSGKVLKNENYILLKNRKELLVEKVLETNESEIYINSVDDFKKYFDLVELTEINNVSENSDKNTIFVASDLLEFPLVLRKHKTGDIFQPFGFNRMKKVAKFFKDEKLSLFQKNSTWILENGNKKIIWIVGLRADDRFKITCNTHKIYKLTFKK